MELTDFTKNGKCSSCGECCSDILPLNKEEIQRIKNYLKEHKVQEFNKEINNFKCPFRNDYMRMCMIYPVRPYICKIFKCDTPVDQAKFNRDEVHKSREVYSMAKEFFDNDKVAGFFELLR